MQSKEFSVPGLPHPVIVHHHEDWTGDIIIEWSDAYTEERKRAEIPAQVLLLLSIQQTKEWVLAEVTAHFKSRSRSFMAELAEIIDNLEGGST